jgi:hypothetical protein
MERESPRLEAYMERNWDSKHTLKETRLIGLHGKNMDR